jgi:hypothetical protein
MRRFIVLFVLMIAVFAPRPTFADAVVRDWLGEYAMNLDGHQGQLQINDSKQDCVGTPWCAFRLSYVGREGPVRGGIERIDDRFQHMVFVLQFPGNTQRFHAYLMSWDKTKIAGTTSSGGRTFGFYAVKGPRGGSPTGPGGASSPTASSGGRSIKRDGTIELTYQDGSKKLMRPGQCGFTRILPNGVAQNVQCIQTPPATPPAPPDIVTRDWLTFHSDSLLDIARAYLVEDSLSNYLANFEAGPISIFDQIYRRTDLVRKLSSLQ